LETNFEENLEENSLEIDAVIGAVGVDFKFGCCDLTLEMKLGLNRLSTSESHLMDDSEL
jgi:hypothetical protein